MERNGELSHLQTVDKVMELKYDAEYCCARRVPFKQFKLIDGKRGDTIMLSNVPPWASQDSLKKIFETTCGPVKAVYFDDADSRLFSWPPPKPARGFKIVYVVFEKASGMRRAIHQMDVSKPFILSSPLEQTVLTGLKKWKREYNDQLLKPQRAEALVREIKTYVDDYDNNREQLKKSAEKAAEADEGGWVTVSRHARQIRKPVGNLSAKGQVKIKARNAKRRKKLELLNFYKFQVREKKLDRLQELKQRFEHDKMKQLKLKQDRQQRRFKPNS